MKRIIAFLLCFVILMTLTVALASAAEAKKIDVRELEEYGQLHFYLGEPVTEDKAPVVFDATVNDGEYAASYEYKYGDKHAIWSDKPSTATFMDNEWVRFYLSYDEDKLYVAIETKDPNYIKGKDGMAFNLGFRDSGRPLDAVTRFCFDMYGHAGAEDDDITTLTTKCRYFIKKDNGDWENPSPSDGMMYISGASIRHDDNSDITTIEVAFDIYFLAKEMGNDLDLKDIRMYFFPFVYMYGESVEGKGDVTSQGILWCYLHGDEILSLKSQFAKDYPQSTYWANVVPSIVHFCSEPSTTEPDVTTAVATTEPNTTTPMVTDISVTASQQSEVTQEAKGCSADVMISAMAIVPMISIAFLNKKKGE